MGASAASPWMASVARCTDLAAALREPRRRPPIAWDSHNTDVSLGAARIGRRKNVHPYVVSHVRREGLRREIENDEHANGDVGYLIRAGLPQVCREASPIRILFLSLQFDDKPKTLEGEHEVDSTTTYVLGLDCVAIEVCRGQPVDEMSLEITLESIRVEQVPRGAALSAFLRASRQRARNRMIKLTTG